MSNGDISDVKHVNEDSLNIQHDWEQSFCAEKDKFFVNYKKYGEASTNYNFICENGRVKLDENSAYKVERNGKKLHIALDNNLSRTFIAPQLEYSTIHKSSVYSVDVSPSENLCISSDANGQLVVWDTARGNIVRDLEGHIMDVYCCRFFPSGLVSLSGGIDMSLRIFSIENGWNARTMTGHKGPIQDIGIIGEGENVVSCSKDGTLKLWNCGDGTVLHEFAPGAGHLNALSLPGDDMNLIGTAGEFNKAFVYDLRTHDAAFTFHPHGNSTSICFDADQHLFVGTENGGINVYDLRANKHLMMLETQRGRINRLLHHNAIGLVGAFNDGTVAAYKNEISLTTGEPSLEFTGSDCDPIYDLSINSTSLFTACRDKIVRKYKF